MNTRRASGQKLRPWSEAEVDEKSTSRPSSFSYRHPSKPPCVVSGNSTTRPEAILHHFAKLQPSSPSSLHHRLSLFLHDASATAAISPRSSKLLLLHPDLAVVSLCNSSSPTQRRSPSSPLRLRQDPAATTSPVSSTPAQPVASPVTARLRRRQKSSPEIQRRRRNLIRSRDPSGNPRPGSKTRKGSAPLLSRPIMKRHVTELNQELV